MVEIHPRSLILAIEKKLAFTERSWKHNWNPLQRKRYLPIDLRKST